VFQCDCVYGKARRISTASARGADPYTHFNAPYIGLQSDLNGDVTKHDILNRIRFCKQPTLLEA
jgi:hypothetical protein